jgi:hypothetical protein
MATKSNNWKVFLELLDKKLKLEKKDQKLNNRDSLQLLELIRSIKTCFMYSSNVLDVKYYRLDDILLALETYDNLGW